MCWSPKIKTKPVQMPQQAPQAAPVSEAKPNLEFGSDGDKKTAETGIGSVTVEPLAENKNNQEASTNFGAPVVAGVSKPTGRIFSSGMVSRATAKRK